MLPPAMAREAPPRFRRHADDAPRMRRLKGPFVFVTLALCGLLPTLVAAQERPLRIGYVTTQFGTARAWPSPYTRRLRYIG